MKHSFILAALVASIAAVPAQAQPVAADLLPAYEVATIVTSMGLRPVGRPAWSAGRYVVAAIDRYGREVNVLLDGRDGQVIAVRPLARNSFGPPPPGYPPRPGPYDPSDGAAPRPPNVVPGSPPADDDEFFDNERQQGALPPRAPARTATAPRETAATGNIGRSAPAARSDRAARDQTPTPRPRPALAKANDPGNAPPAKPADKPAAAKSDETRPDAAKDAAKPDAKQASAPQTAKPEPATPDAANKPEAGKREIRVIDLSKPKTTVKPEDKPGEAIRF